MLHYSEIEKRLQSNPEPIEVTKMRKRILDAFSCVEFIEEGHIYNIHNADGTVTEKVPSVSSVIGKFEQKEDWDAIAKKYGEKHGMAIEDVKRMWHENNIRATNNGSLIHEYGESMQRFATGELDMITPRIKPQLEDGYLIPYGNKQDAILAYWKDLMKVGEIYPLLPECKMYMPKDNKYGIKDMFCGTADITLAYKHKGKWSILLHDYKTNRELTSNFNRSYGKMMLEPFNNLVDEALSHYTLQLSIYSMMLENIGFDVIDRKLIWLKDSGEYEKVALPYVKEQIINALS